MRKRGQRKTPRPQPPTTRTSNLTDLTYGLLGWLKTVSKGAVIVLRAISTPSPTHRPRMTKTGHAYYAKTYQTYHADCVRAFSKLVNKTRPLTGLLACVVETVCAKPKSTKLAAPRGDTDNYTKCPLDAATKAGVWGDDAQVIPVTGTRRWAEPGEEPGVYLHIGKLK